MHRLRRPAALLIAAALAAVLPAGPRAQEAPGPLLFPGVLPAEAHAVLSVPRADGAWRAFESMRIVGAAEGALRDAALGPAGSPVGFDGAALFGGVFSASELALVPGDAGREAFLWLARVKDPVRLTDGLETIEKAVLQRAAETGVDVTRSVESIGDAQLVALVDAESAVGWFLDGPTALWALSNDLGVLRDAARRNALRGTRRHATAGKGLSADAAPGAGASAFPEIARAWQGLAARSRAGADSFHVRFFIPAPARREEAGLPGLGPVLESLNLQGAAAGGLRFTPDSIELEAFTPYGPDPENVAARLYREAAASEAAPGADLAAREALIFGGSRLLDAALLKHWALTAVESVRASLPDARRENLAPASALAVRRLDALAKFLAKPDALQEFGPRWFFALNHFRFDEPGVFPDVGFLLGVETRDPAAARQRMLSVESAFLAAADAHAETTGTVRVAERVYDVGGRSVAIRSVEAPGLPAHLRPAWCADGEWLLIDLSPQSLIAALERRAATPASLEDLDAARRDLGVANFHAFQAIRFRRAANVLQAVAAPLLERIDPKAGVQLQNVTTLLEPIELIAFFRTGDAEGVRTAGQIRMTPPDEGFMP